MGTHQEVQLDGLVGPTHHYAGLAFGNVASEAHEGAVSNPREAALQSLAMMRRLLQMGQTVAVMPPLERPAIHRLRALGFEGSDEAILARAAAAAPKLLSLVSSASSMWTANAATVIPSLDTLDERVHILPANLMDKPHRAFEADETTTILRRIFADERRFAVHDPLPSTPMFADEGAANHMRLARRHSSAGLHVFVYGRDDLDPQGPRPVRFPARQSRQASEAAARVCQLEPERFVTLQQHPRAIDQGVFHNDVIALANENVLLLHEEAFLDCGVLREAAHRHVGSGLQVHTIKRNTVGLDEAVRSYFFNGQLVTLPAGGGMALVLPEHCRESEGVQLALEEIQASDTPLARIEYVDLLQSMRNGGGPGCLRLRVLLDKPELRSMHQGVLATEAKLDALSSWVTAHYRDRLHARDLADPALLQETRTALDALTQLLELGSIYPFQQG